MPIIQINMMEGRSPDQKQAMMRRVTEAVVETLGVRAEAVRIIVQEIPSGHFAVGGEPRFAEGAEPGPRTEPFRIGAE
ncbi:2-hydroxymuconate tautomerase [Neomegalonema sp.]|uniref:2-hydroxymuconate tautomerase n=1 Tax=Neomegalonema sp. TaxID=2039713 RepID=UPI0026298E65|nr:2-hydroxymuconate tautomerase [Neomegalonema sp.]MDD2869776.1 2-hydroxymuconate tautomerase family protein [Neomegalonema sp.]